MSIITKKKEKPRVAFQMAVPTSVSTSVSHQQGRELKGVRVQVAA